MEFLSTGFPSCSLMVVTWPPRHIGKYIGKLLVWNEGIHESMNEFLRPDRGDKTAPALSCWPGLLSLYTSNL